MTKTIVVCGYGPGISDAVARKFGSEGFQVALVARSKDKLESGVAALEKAGVKAKAFPCDLGDAAAVKRLIGDVRSSLGPVTVLHWNAYVGLAGDLLTSSAEDFKKVMDVAVTGLTAAVQEALPDLKSQPNPAVLVTSGGFGLFIDAVDAVGVQYNAMGLSVANAAKHKLVRLLHHKLAPQGIYVGEVMVLSSVKGTVFDPGNATLEASTIANHFWDLYQKRKEFTVTAQ